MNDDLSADLGRIGDALEIAIARDIAGTPRTGGNTSDVFGHVSVDHTHVTTETDMHIIDPIDQLDQTSHPLPAVGRLKLRSRRIAIISAVAVLGIGGAAAATAVKLSSDDVSHGLPGGSLLFTGTNPSCSSSDDVVFHCRLASVPTLDVQNDYTGAAEIFVDANSDVAGGCRGQSADGLEWICYVGQRAVDEEIVSEDFLGQHVLGPGAG